MTIFESITLGAVQGITEFLPVSSSGHLQLAKEILGVTISDNLTFDIALHAGTVCSTILIFWTEIVDILKGVFKFDSGKGLNEQQKFALKIAISLIPIAVVGLFAKQYIEEILNSPQNILIVGIMLLITALLLLLAHKTPITRGKGKDITYRDSFIIGLAQAAAVMPGISRSGATIATGIILGKERAKVAQFSFLMVLIPILGNTLLDIIKGGGTIQIEGLSTTTIAIGFLTAFIVGAAACKAMIEVVKRGKLLYFAIYCAIAGAISIVTYFI